MRAIDATENAFVVRYSTDNNPTAIYNLYSHLTEVVGEMITGAITNVEMLSPNVGYFEIAVYVTANPEATDPQYKERVEELYKKVESHIVSVLGLSLTKGDMRKGINIGGYNGLYPEFASYRIVSGETLTLDGELELLDGQPCLASDDYGYGTGTYNLEKGTLNHKNYNIDFISGSFTVVSREISDYGFSGGVWEESTNTLTVKQGSDWNIYVDTNGKRRELDKAELSFYTDPDYVKLEEEPTSPGTYYVKVAGDGAFTIKGTEKRLDFILTITE